MVNRNRLSPALPYPVTAPTQFSTWIRNVEAIPEDAIAPLLSRALSIEVAALTAKTTNCVPLVAASSAASAAYLAAIASSNATSVSFTSVASVSISTASFILPIA